MIGRYSERPGIQPADGKNRDYAGTQVSHSAGRIDAQASSTEKVWDDGNGAKARKRPEAISTVTGLSEFASDLEQLTAD